MFSVDDKISKVTWSTRFTEGLGFRMNLNVAFQDNASTIKLAENEKLSSGKMNRHFYIRLFHVTDLISRNEVTIKCCPTRKTLADQFIKRLFGKLFQIRRSDVMIFVFRE